MLQRITGRFYQNKDVHISQGRGILYSNFSWVTSIDTVVGQLEPVDTYRAVASYVFSYENKIENTGTGFSVVRIGDAEIVNQFKLLCSFGLSAYFAEDRAQVEHHCRPSSKSSSDTFVPARFLPRVFSQRISGDYQ